ncbi:MAG: amidohydrolase family protein [Ardenticatenaceae bacterium]|nr:amidohydrolase family protein [Ardenticatenaceae bacterium]
MDRGAILARIEEGAPLNEWQVIDCHVHIGGGTVWQYIPRARTDEMVVTMDRLGIDAVVASAYRALFEDYRLGNDEIIQATEEFPGRVLGYAVVNPHFPDDAEGELRRCFQMPGIKGIKIHPASYIHDYPIDGPNYRAVWEFASDRGCPVLTHAGPRTERHTCGSERIANVVEQYPDLHLIIGHTGAYDTWDALDEHIAIAERHDNVCLDISGTARIYGVVDYLVQRVGHEKVLYGSDASEHTFEVEIGHVVYAHIGDEAKANILGRNMARLLAF